MIIISEQQQQHWDMGSERTRYGDTSAVVLFFLLFLLLLFLTSARAQIQSHPSTITENHVILQKRRKSKPPSTSSCYMPTSHFLLLSK